MISVSFSISCFGYNHVFFTQKIMAARDEEWYMEKISKDLFFAKYPKLSNLDELKKADILIMPKYHDAFSLDQRLLGGLSSEYNIKCLFYSEDQKILRSVFLNSISADAVILFGSVISTATALIQIYEYLMKKIPDKKIKIKHVISEDDSFYEFEEFEGTMKDYKKFLDDKETR